jgi:hypothetical protein
MTGKGSLAKLGRLKAEYGPKFRASAPKIRRINQKCLDLFCPTAIGRVGLDRGSRLRIRQATCTRKRCPKEEVGK